MEVLAVLLVLMSVGAALGGIIWLVAALIVRRLSVRKPLGVVVVGIVMFIIGFVVLPVNPENDTPLAQDVTSFLVETPTPVPVDFNSTDDRLVAISSGVIHTCGLRISGVAVCWGFETTSSLAPPYGERFKTISAGDFHTCGLREDGSAICWGDNFKGQSNAPKSQRFTAMSSGGDHNCGLREDGSVICWGQTSLSFGKDNRFVELSNNGGYGCGLREDGIVICSGIRGNESIMTVAVMDGDILMTQRANEHNEVATMFGVDRFVTISSGGRFTCGIRVDGSHICKVNAVSDLVSPESERFVSISSGGRHVCGLREDGFVVCWGNSEKGQTSPPKGMRFAAISSGASHTCGLTAEGKVACWGDNSGGQSTPHMNDMAQIP